MELGIRNRQVSGLSRQGMLQEKPLAWFGSPGGGTTCEQASGLQPRAKNQIELPAAANEDARSLLRRVFDEGVSMCGLHR